MRWHRHICASLLAAMAFGAAGLTAAGCASSATVETGATTAPASMVMSSSATATAATTTSPSAARTPTSSTGTGLFDSSVVHEISASFAQEDYEEMLASYKDSGAKDWIEATVTIDGSVYEKAGMRLKGNSSIRGLKDGRVGGPGGNVSAAEPEGLPWLIRLDKNVEGQNHDGVTDFVVRSNTWRASLNEAVSLELLEMAGLASQEAVAVGFAVNGSEAVLRLVTELPEEIWMQEHFSPDGALYKAESTGDYTFRGNDPDAYAEVFDQEAGKGNADLRPLIGFLDFINNSDDATFNATLPDRLDVESFAVYLAMEELIGNFDDIDGPGNNSYLYYDAETGRFTVVPWDHNLSFGGMGGGGDRRVGGGSPWGGVPSGGEAPPEGGKPSGEGGLPGGGLPGSPRGKSNILVQRFHANPEFEALYQESLTELKTQLYESGAAADILARWVTLLETQASDLIDQATVNTEAAKIATYFEAG